MTSNTDALCAAWLDAKRAENRAKDQRIAVEAQLSEAFEVPSEGSKTHNTESHKITLTQPMRRSLDVDEWEKVKGNIPPDMHPVQVKIEADATGCKYLANNEPDAWKRIASAFETKPGKTSVKVEAK